MRYHLKIRAPRDQGMWMEVTAAEYHAALADLPDRRLSSYRITGGTMSENQVEIDVAAAEARIASEGMGPDTAGGPPNVAESQE